MAAENPVTPVQKKILHFFREHPHAVETLRGMATWLGAEEKAIQEALDGLVGRKWLSTHETSVVTAYTLTHNERHLNEIQETLDPPKPS